MEYGILFFEYFLLKGLRYFLFKSFILALIAFGIYYFINESIFIKKVIDFTNNNINILGILIGFTVSVFTIFITVENSNLNDSKKILVGKQIFSKEISLYDSLVINLAYLIVIQGLSLIVNFIFPLFIPLESEIGKKVLAVNITFTINIILILVRSILDFYFILSKK